MALLEVSPPPQPDLPLSVSGSLFLLQVLCTRYPCDQKLCKLEEAMTHLVEHTPPAPEETLNRDNTDAGAAMSNPYLMDLKIDLSSMQTPQEHTNVLQDQTNGLMAVTIVHQPQHHHETHLTHHEQHHIHQEQEQSMTHAIQPDATTLLHDQTHVVVAGPLHEEEHQHQQHPQAVMVPTPGHMQQQQQQGSRYKRHWLSMDQVAKVEDAFVSWKGNWRGKEAQLKSLAAELNISVEKLKKRVDYMRRRREGKPTGGDGLSDDGGFGDDNSSAGTAPKRPRPLGAGGAGGVRLSAPRIPTEPYHPPKCLFSHIGCSSTPETGGQVMIVVTPTCGHRWVCLSCFSEPYKVDEYIKLTGACPTCRETPLSEAKQLMTLLEAEVTKQLCKWCRIKNRNLAFTPCGHISEYCIDCFDQCGTGHYAREEICTTCEQKFAKTLQI